MIRRSATVSAPNAICFPGGGIERNESEEQALIRELQEELAIVQAEPVERLWTSVTQRGVHLAWWLTRIPKRTKLQPDLAEVAEWFWWSEAEMARCETLLDSNREFLAWWRSKYRAV